MVRDAQGWSFGEDEQESKPGRIRPSGLDHLNAAAPGEVKVQDEPGIGADDKMLAGPVDGADTACPQLLESGVNSPERGLLIQTGILDSTADKLQAQPLADDLEFGQFEHE